MQKIKRTAVITPIIILVLLFRGCGKENTSLTDAEASAFTVISGVPAENFSDISRETLTKERAAKFPAATKVYKLQNNLYGFIVKPVAYNGPVTLAVVINEDSGKSLGMRIVSHSETPHYVRDMESSWFTERFANKSAYEYLKLARLRAHNDNEIVAITGATVTTEGIINGVNAALGVYAEMSGHNAEPVPYMVRFEPGEGEGPSETEILSIRAYGVVLAEVSLDDIRNMPSVKRTMSIHSSAAQTQHSFRGTLLSNILDSIDPKLKEEYNWALAIGVDDYISGIDMDEIKSENNVYVMYEDNGEPLLRKNGEPGAMRVVVLDDFFGQRFTNYLLEIVLEKEVNTR